MKSPIQAPPVNRLAVAPAPAQSATQSGCCVRVAGQCLLESPLC
jgi:hypothetical protein